MKSIIINETNKAKIETAIQEAEGRATMRTISYNGIVRATQRIEQKLGVPKKYLEGVRFDVDFHAQNFPNAYKYRAESTHFVVEYSKGKWRVVSIERAYTRTAGHDFVCLTMPEETKRAIVEKMMNFC